MRFGSFALALFFSLLTLPESPAALPATSIPTTTPSAKPSLPIARDLAEYRSRFPTRLLVHGPAPDQTNGNVVQPVPAGAREITYQSGSLNLKAWVNDIPVSGKPRPAVVYCHPGFELRDEYWTSIKSLLDAGLIVMLPSVRGENGNPGEFTYEYDEVDDIVAAGKWLATQPGVDSKRLFVVGTGVGGDLAVRAVMEENPFALSLPINAVLDMRFMRHLKDGRSHREQVFDVNDLHELESRSAILFTAGLRAPIHLMISKDDVGDGTEEKFVALAQYFGHPALLTVVDGPAGTIAQAALPLAIDMINDFSPTRRLVVDWPAGWKPVIALHARQEARVEPGTSNHCFVNVDPVGLRPPGTTLDSYVESTRRNFTHLRNFSITPSVGVEIAGQHIIQFDKTSVIDGKPAKFRQFCFRTKHYFINVVGVIDPAQEDQTPRFEDVIAGIHEAD